MLHFVDFVIFRDALAKIIISNGAPNGHKKMEARNYSNYSDAVPE